MNKDLTISKKEKVHSRIWMDSMERLTEKVGDHFIARQDRLNGKIVGNQMCLDMLGKYENLEEKGLILRLPCKVGDTVYRVFQDGEYCVSWWTIEEIKFTLSYYEKNKDNFGKTIFLTKEEAERVLEEMKSTH